MPEKKLVLLVEDEVSLAQPLKEKLEAKGLTVILAKNGQEGLDLALKNKPNLILLDITMPVMDGVEMLKALRTDDAGKSMQVIMMTNVSDAVKAGETAGLGVLDYIVKADWKLSDIVDKVSERLGV